MSGLIRTRPSPDRVVPAPATGGSRHRGEERWPPPPPPGLRRRSPPGSHQGQHGPRLARASPLLPQSPPPTLSLPLLRSPEPRQTPLRPRPAPLSRLPQPRRSSRCALPGGYGGAPGLPTLGLGAFAPPAAPRRLPAPPGTQRLRAPRARIPAGPVAGGGLGRPRLGPEPHFHCRLPHPLLLLPAPRAPWGQEPPTRGRLCHLELYRCPSRRAGIGIGFYGNSETSDGVSQLSSALLHANHTLSTIDHLVLETVERLGEAVRTELTSLEEVLAQRTELVAAARGARRQAEAVTQQLQGLAFWRGVPLSPLQVAEDVSFVEEYRWLAYVLLLLLELLVCLFTLLGLAKQSKWLVIVMAVMSLLVLVLSWGSMGLEAATAVGLSDFCSSPDTYILNLTEEETGLDSDILNYYFLCNQAVSNPFQQRLTLSQRALANIHSQLQGLEREAVPQFPDAQKPLLSLEETLNVTEGNFHQLVALLHCRGLHKDYGAALRGLCEDALEGLLLLLLFSLLSAGALATALCSLPRAWALFPPSDDYDDTDDDDPFNPQESKRFVQWQSSI
ncbi:protein tweety homolog 1 isoform X1 [Leopardus geoffroyi]|uniref:protein tweety homolog 1 isoform X1 n=1 Tax=Leopardus geoffroyi TaxID=46844 RepID=UPI001E26210E|nr:protein tweety homolog 1 isoform X1 [Leopardus geoffroyi]